MTEPKNSDTAPRAQAPLSDVQGQGLEPPGRNHVCPDPPPESVLYVKGEIAPETQAVTVARRAVGALISLTLSYREGPHQGWAGGRMTCCSDPSCYQRAIVQARMVASLAAGWVQNMPDVRDTKFAAGEVVVEMMEARSIESAYVWVGNDGLQVSLPACLCSAEKRTELGVVGGADAAVEFAKYHTPMLGMGDIHKRSPLSEKANCTCTVRLRTCSAFPFCIRREGGFRRANKERLRRDLLLLSSRSRRNERRVSAGS